MKTLNLHVDYIKFKPLKKALRKIDDLKEKENVEKSVENALAVLIAVEKGDNNVLEVVEKFVESVKDVAGKLGVKNVVLYPYAHLSKDLASPELAIDVMDKSEKKLKKDFKVTKAPFGYYKEFEMKVKGHPLSELSREIRVAGTDGGSEIYDSKKLLHEISKTKLDSSKLKDNDHRILGQKMDLFSFNETAPGMVFWHDKGLTIFNELVNFWREVHRKNGYEEIKTPQILDKRLWQISGHWEKYKENIFLTDYEKRNFAVKPMNCPGGMLVYKNTPKSYRDLPLRVGELGIVHRQELSGVLGGLFRVIQFTQDDAHIYCNEKQLENEIIRVIDLIDYFYKAFNFIYSVELSTRPEKRIGGVKIWDKAEKTLKKVLEKKKMSFKINKGDGAFYGPKIDFHIKDSLGRTWQCATVQLDFAMPERFELEYMDKDNKKKRPIMLHRVIYGSLERFIGILLEHTNGKLLLWLSPVQVKVLPMTDKNLKYSEKIAEKLKDAGVRVEIDSSSESMGKKVRNAQLEKVFYMLTIGDKEEEKKTIAVRGRDGKIEFNVGLDDFILKLREEIRGRV